MEQSIISNKLRSLMNEQDITPLYLSEQTKIPKATIYSMLSGRVNNPQLDTIYKLCSFFKLTFDGFLLDSKDASNHIVPTVSREIPILSWVESINYKGWLKDNADSDWEDTLLVRNTVSSDAFCVQTKPNMEPRFATGTYLVVEPSISPEDNMLVLVHFKNTNEATLRKYILDGSDIILQSVTDSQTDQVFISESMSIIGSVTQSRCLFNI